MNIVLNGAMRSVENGMALADLVASVTDDPQSLATAVNGEFVPRDARAELQLQEGDAVFTFQPITGG